MWPNLQDTEDLVTFADKLLNGRIHFFRSVIHSVKTLKKYM